MAEQTGISWCHATLNFWVGCTKVSTGAKGACAFCYAENWAKRWPAYRETWGVGATRVRFKDTRAKALKLERLAIASGEPFYCFSNSLSDIFDNEVAIEWLAEAFDDMRAAPHVTFLLLTKRAPNIVKRVQAAGGLPPNAALMITVVTQPEADRDIRHLLEAKAVLKPLFVGVSMEPLMGPVDIRPWLPTFDHCPEEGEAVPAHLRIEGQEACQGCTGRALHPLDDCRAVWTPGIDWVIAGGESGHQARPAHPDWLRGLRDQCAAAGVPFHFKQWGEWTPGENVGAEVKGTLTGAWLCSDGTWNDERITEGESQELHYQDEPDVWRIGKKRAGRLLDGVLHDAMPEVRS